MLDFVPLAGAGRQVADHDVDAAGHSSVRWREIARETVAAEEVRFALDSPLEQRGFELAVPPRPARGPVTSELHPSNAQESNGGRTGAALPAAL